MKKILAVRNDGFVEWHCILCQQVVFATLPKNSPKTGEEIEEVTQHMEQAHTKECLGQYGPTFRVEYAWGLASPQIAYVAASNREQIERIFAPVATVESCEPVTLSQLQETRCHCCGNLLRFMRAHEVGDVRLFVEIERCTCGDEE